MNKFKLLEMVLEKYDEKMGNSYRIKEQNELIALFLREPDASTNWLHQQMNRICKRTISKNELFIMRRFLWLNCKYFTNMFIHDVKTLTHYLFTFYNENVSYYHKILNKMEELKKMTGSKSIYRNYDTKVYRAVLCLFFSNDVFIELNNKEVIKRCSGSYAEFLLEDLTTLMANHLGIETKKEVKKIDVKGADYVERLEFQLESIKGNFEHIKQLYDQQSEELEIYKVSIEEETVLDFFKQFNSPRHGNILDQIHFIDQKIRNLEKSGVEFNDEIKSVPILIKQLYKFLTNIGIAPIKQLNQSYRVTVDDIEFFEYVGEPFYTDDEEKEVVVTSAGWTFKGRTISNPKVREL